MDLSWVFKWKSCPLFGGLPAGVFWLLWLMGWFSSWYCLMRYTSHILMKKTDAGHLPSTLESSWLEEEIRQLQSESRLHSALTIFLRSAAGIHWDLLQPSVLVHVEPPALLRRNASHRRSKEKGFCTLHSVQVLCVCVSADFRLCFEQLCVVVSPNRNATCESFVLWTWLQMQPPGTWQIVPWLRTEMFLAKSRFDWL